jgi:hypothetical protein
MSEASSGKGMVTIKWRAMSMRRVIHARSCPMA